MSAPSPWSPRLADYKETLRTVADYQGLALRRPVLAALLAFFLLSLIGIPFTGGFFGKFYVFTAALQAGHVWLAVIGLHQQRRRLLLLPQTAEFGLHKARGFCFPDNFHPNSSGQRARRHRPDTGRSRHADAGHSARPCPPHGQLRQFEPAHNLRASAASRTLRRQRNPVKPTALEHFFCNCYRPKMNCHSERSEESPHFARCATVYTFSKNALAALTP